MKDLHRFILDICAIVAYSFLFFFPLGIFGGPVGDFSGFPKGDDAQIHASLIRFFSKNWPHFRWFPFWYGGFPISLSYHPLANYVWALFVMVTGSSVEFTLFFFSAFSYMVTAIALYLIIYTITENHNSALIAPILTVTSGGFVGTLAAGGAYTRIFATMLWILSFYFLINYLKTGGNRKFSLATVVILASVVTSNVLIGIFAGLTAVATLFLCIEGWKRKLLQIFKIFLPVFFLSAFFYIPFFFSYLNTFVSFGFKGGHYSTPMPLLYFGASSFLPLLYLLFSTLLVRFLKIKFDGLKSNVLKTLKVLIVFLFLYGFLDWPKNVRFFATYDTTYFLPIYLSIYNGVLLGGIFDKMRSLKLNTTGLLPPQSSFINIKQKGRKILPIFTLLGVFIMPIFYRPILALYVVDSGARSWYYPAFAAEQLLKIDPNNENFRFSTDWIHVIRWFNYRYSDVSQTSGGHAMAILYPDWYSWFDEAVFTTKENWQETNFLLDWYAVKYLLIGNVTSYSGGEILPRYGLIDKYLSKPEYYENVSMIEVPEGFWAGPIYQFNYRYVTPIISTTNATTMLVVGEPQSYDNLFRSLAYANFNGRYVIPIRGQKFIDEYSLEQLKKFDVVFVVLNGNYYSHLDKAWELLHQYVKDGGGLFLEGSSSGLPFIPSPSPVTATHEVNFRETKWNFSIAEHETTNLTNFVLFSSPDSMSYYASGNIRPWAKAVLRNNNDALVVVGEYEKGRVLWSGLSLSQRIRTSKNFMEALFLSEMLKWVSKNPEEESRFEVSQVESLANCSVSWTTPAAQGNITLDDSIKKIGKYSLKLGYRFADPVNQDEVNYRFDPPGRWNFSAAEFFSMWLFGDGSNNEVKVYLEKTDSRDALVFKIRLEWKGWRQITYWFDQMDKYGLADKSLFDKIEITINDAPPVNVTSSYIYVDGIYTGARSLSPKSPELTFKRPNPERVEIYVTDLAKGILFKESYFDRWYAYSIGNDGLIEELDIYRAGPDFMYVSLPENALYPMTVVFEYRQAPIELIAYAFSAVTLVVLISYGIGMPFLKRFPYIFGKFNRNQSDRRAD